MWRDEKNVCVSNFECVQRKDYERIIVTTALYGAETWNVGAVEMKRLNVWELRYLRSMCGVTLMNRVRNDEMSRRTVVLKQLADGGEQGVLRWFGLRDWEKGTWVKRITGSDIRGTRPRGRPQIGWMDRVKRALDAT